MLGRLIVTPEGVASQVSSTKENMSPGVEGVIIIIAIIIIIVIIINAFRMKSRLQW